MRTRSHRPESGRREARLGQRIRDLRSYPVLPSMVTLGNLFFGFLAMAKCADAVIAQGSAVTLTPEALRLFEIAAVLVFLAMLFDALDGAVARLTNQTTQFGAQLDSLADVVTFGVAPAFIAKMLVDFFARPDVNLLPYHPKLYWACAAVYVLCAAMRLARYNVEAGADAEAEDAEADHDGSEFKGLPSPAAAAVVCAMVAFFTTRGDPMHSLSAQLLPPEFYDRVVVWMPAALVLLGVLMVSRFPFPHMIATLLRGRHGFPFLATMVALVIVAAIEWQVALGVLSVSYVLAGILLGSFRLLTTGTMAPRRRDGDGDGDGDGGPAGGDDDGDLSVLGKRSLN